MSSIQVVVYDIWRAPLLEQRQYYFSSLSDATAETAQPNFIASFKPAKYFSFRYNFRDDVEPPVVETNVHFIATFKPVSYVLYSFRFDIEDNPDIEPPVIETNPHFVSSFKPVSYIVSSFRSEVEDLQDIQPPVIETNPHFIFRFKNVPFNWYKFNDKDHILFAHITSTHELQNPIDYFLMGGENLLQVFDPLAPTKPMFTVTTTKKGH